MTATAVDLRVFETALARISARPGVRAALVVTSDGLPLAGEMGPNAHDDHEAWAAVAAALGNLAGRLSVSLGPGELESVLFQAEQQQFLVRPLPMGFLVVVAEGEPPGAEIEAAAEEITRAAHTQVGARDK